MSQIFGNSLAWLIDITIGTYILVVILRFLLQKLRADFHNPVSQFVLKATSQLLNPMRKVIPGYAGLDISSLVLAYGLSVIKIFLILFFSGFGFHLFIAIGRAIPDLVDSFLSVFLYAIFIQAIFSWIPNMQYNPASSVLNTLTRPILNFVRQYIPYQAAGFDFSSLIAIIAIMFIKLTLIPLLNLFFIYNHIKWNYLFAVYRNTQRHYRASIFSIILECFLRHFNHIFLCTNFF